MPWTFAQYFCYATDSTAPTVLSLCRSKLLLFVLSRTFVSCPAITHHIIWADGRTVTCCMLDQCLCLYAFIRRLRICHISVNFSAGLTPRLARECCSRQNSPGIDRAGWGQQRRNGRLYPDQCTKPSLNRRFTLCSCETITTMGYRTRALGKMPNGLQVTAGREI